jgi:hypothetical protein
MSILTSRGILQFGVKVEFALWPCGYIYSVVFIDSFSGICASPLDLNRAAETE